VFDDSPPKTLDERLAEAAPLDLRFRALLKFAPLDRAAAQRSIRGEQQFNDGARVRRTDQSYIPAKQFRPGQLRVETNGFEQRHFVVVQAVRVTSVGIRREKSVEICCVFVRCVTPIRPHHKFQQR